MATSPRHAQVVSTSDTLNHAFVTSYIAFTNSGTQTLKIDTAGGEIGVSIVLPSGMWPIAAKKIYTTGTTVTTIVAFWDA